jgi:hypothetical protein
MVRACQTDIPMLLAVESGSVIGWSLYVVLLCALGVMVGVALQLLAAALAHWLHRRRNSMEKVRQWRATFLVCGAVPVLVIPVLAGVDMRLASDVTEGSLYLLGFWSGFLGVPIVRYLRSRR